MWQNHILEADSWWVDHTDFRALQCLIVNNPVLGSTFTYASKRYPWTSNQNFNNLPFANAWSCPSIHQTVFASVRQSGFPNLLLGIIWPRRPICFLEAVDRYKLCTRMSTKWAFKRKTISKLLCSICITKAQSTWNIDLDLIYPPRQCCSCICIVA